MIFMVKAKTASVTRHALAIFFFAMAITPEASYARTTTQLQPTKVTVYNLSFSPSIQAILKMTIERSMELTKEEYGEYTITYHKQRTNDKKVSALVANGETIQINFSAHGKIQNDDSRIANIDVNFLTNLLGLRQLTVHQDNIAAFESISSIEELRLYTVGLGLYWADRKVYEHYQLRYEEAILPSSLIPMLEAKRFDYLSESILDEGLRGKDTKNTTLSSLYMYYPIPLQMHINASNTILIERLKLGLERYITTGEPQRLLKENFIKKLEAINNAKLLVVYNPAYSASKNKEIIKSFFQLIPENTFKVLSAPL